MLSLIFIIRIALNTLIFVVRNTSVFPKYYKNIYFPFPMSSCTLFLTYENTMCDIIFHFHHTVIALTTIIFVIKLYKKYFSLHQILSGE
jgi:hypothetical protein